MVWFALVNAENKIVGNAVEGDGLLDSLPDGVAAIISQHPAPNPRDHEVALFDGQKIIRPRQPTLDEIKARAKLFIDTVAGRVRATYITATPGQAEVYQEKLAEAREVRARLDTGESVTAADYPFLQAEMTVTGADLSATADTILAIAAQWRTVGAAIEQARRAGKLAIDAAVDKTGAEQARDGAAATLRGMANGAT